MKTMVLSRAVSFLYSHEAVDGGQVVPGAEQEEGETDEDKQAAEVHEEILHDEPPEADPTEIHWDVLTLEEQRQRRGQGLKKVINPSNDARKNRNNQTKEKIKEK